MEHERNRAIPRLGSVAADAKYTCGHMPGRKGRASSAKGRGSTVKNGDAVNVLLALNSVLSKRTRLRDVASRTVRKERVNRNHFGRD